MITQKQLVANRRNAQKSTGPRSQEGKAIVSQNAIQHGLLCKHSLLPGEDEEEFHRFYEALRSHLRPEGALEELFFERIVECSWRLRRLGMVESGLFIRSHCELVIQNAQDVIDDADPFVLVEKKNGRTIGRRSSKSSDGPIRMKDVDSWMTEEEKAAQKLEVEAAQARIEHAEQRLAHGEGNLGEVFTKDAGRRDAFTKLSRYEMAMQRNLTRSLHELQRLQADRAGKAVMPPIVVDVDVSNDPAE